MIDFGEHSRVLADDMAPEWPLYRMTEQAVPDRDADEWVVVTVVSTLDAADNIINKQQTGATSERD